MYDSKFTKNKRWLITLNRKWVLKKWIHFNLEHLKTNRLSIWTYFRSGSKLPKRSIWILNFKNASTPKPLRGRVLNLVCRGTFECFFTWKHFWSRPGTFTDPQIYLGRLPIIMFVELAFNLTAAIWKHNKLLQLLPRKPTQYLG